MIEPRTKRERKIFNAGVREGQKKGKMDMLRLFNENQALKGKLRYLRFFRDLQKV